MIIETLKSGKHRVRVWDNELGTKIPVGTFKTKAAAKSAGMKAEIELSTRGAIAERRDKAFGALCDMYLSTVTNLAISTQVWYANALKPARRHFGEKSSVRRITKAEVQAYASALTREKKSANTVRSYVKVVSILMAYAVEHGFREDNPATRLRNLPKKKRAEGSVRAITREEHALLVACVPTSFSQGRGVTRFRGYQSMISVLPLIGLRRSEAQGLTWDMVDFESQTLRVECQLRPDGELDPQLKTEKARRTVSMPELVVRDLRAWKLECPPNDLNLVFPGQRGGGQNQAQFYRVWKKAVVAAGLDGLDPHDLRHTFATWNLAAGCNPKWVADQMGHEKPSIMLDVYAHLLPSADEEASRKIEAWLEKQAV